jgi:hypothetical protein
MLFEGIGGCYGQQLWEICNMQARLYVGVWHWPDKSPPTNVQGFGLSLML